MPLDPRINCAAEICCGVDDAAQAQIGLIQDLGCSHEEAVKISTAMSSAELVFMPKSLAKVIAEIVDVPRGKPK